LLFGLGVLVLVEGLMRVALGPPPPAIRVFSGLAQEHSRFLEASSEGWKTTYQRAPTLLDADTYAAVIGGSSVHRGSPGVSLEREFPAIAEQRIHRSVANLGAPGLDSHELVALTQELADLPVDEGRPEVLVVYTGHNDFGNARFHARYGSLSAGVGAHIQSALEELQLYSQLSRFLRPVRGSSRRGHDGFVASLEEETWNRVALHLFKNLARLAHIATKAEMRVVFVIPVSNLFGRPSDPTCDESRCPGGRYDLALTRLAEGDEAGAAALLREARDQDRLALRAPAKVGEELRALAEGEPWVSVVDAEADLPSSAGIVSEKMFIDPIHFSRAGHRALGELLGRHLEGLEVGATPALF